MLTVDGLKAWGADTAQGISRCMGNEGFYLGLVPKVLEDKNFDNLTAAIGAHDLDAAFAAAHGLKGMLGNLALTPIYEPVVEITELLRARTDTDYAPYLQKITEKKEELKGMVSEQ